LPRSVGIHHVSAITSNAQRNLDFYVGFLGLRLIKQAVNFEDPDVYHLFYGDETGSPGSVMTFFVWPGSHRGQQGAGQVAVTSFTIHPTSLAFWIDRLLLHGIRFEGPSQRPSSRSGTESVLSFRDPDGLLLEIVTHPRARDRPSWGGVPDVPPEHAIHGFHSIPPRQEPPFLKVRQDVLRRCHGLWILTMREVMVGPPVTIASARKGAIHGDRADRPSLPGERIREIRNRPTL